MYSTREAREGQCLNGKKIIKFCENKDIYAIYADVAPLVTKVVQVVESYTVLFTPFRLCFRDLIPFLR